MGFEAGVVGWEAGLASWRAGWEQPCSAISPHSAIARACSPLTPSKLPSGHLATQRNILSKLPSGENTYIVSSTGRAVPRVHHRPHHPFELERQALSSAPLSEPSWNHCERVWAPRRICSSSCVDSQ